MLVESFIIHPSRCSKHFDHKKVEGTGTINQAHYSKSFSLAFSFTVHRCQSLFDPLSSCWKKTEHHEIKEIYFVCDFTVILQRRLSEHKGAALDIRQSAAVKKLFKRKLAVFAHVDLSRYDLLTVKITVCNDLLLHVDNSVGP